MIPVEDFLVQQGFEKLAAGTWAKFLHAVFDALREAEAMVTSDEYWSEHRKKDGAFLKPRAGVTGNRRLPSEEGLTHALYDCLWKVKARSDFDHPLRDLAIEFHSEAKMTSRRRTGKRARRTDIWARSSKNEVAPDIVLEAKLVTGDYDLTKGYLGPDGLGCFLGPTEPYTQGPLGGLLAYTVDGTLIDWLKRIAAALTGPPAIAISQHWIALGHVSEMILCSRVERPLLGIPAPIVMVHVVMRFEAEPIVPRT